MRAWRPLQRLLQGGRASGRATVRPMRVHPAMRKPAVYVCVPLSDAYCAYVCVSVPMAGGCAQRAGRSGWRRGSGRGLRVGAAGPARGAPRRAACVPPPAARCSHTTLHAPADKRARSWPAARRSRAARPSQALPAASAGPNLPSPAPRLAQPVPSQLPLPPTSNLQPPTPHRPPSSPPAAPQTAQRSVTAAAARYAAVRTALSLLGPLMWCGPGKGKGPAGAKALLGHGACWGMGPAGADRMIRGCDGCGRTPRPPLLLPANAARRFIIASSHPITPSRSALLACAYMPWLPGHCSLHDSTPSLHPLALPHRGSLALELALVAVGPDYGRVVRAVFLLAQVRGRGPSCERQEKARAVEEGEQSRKASSRGRRAQGRGAGGVEMRG